MAGAAVGGGEEMPAGPDTRHSKPMNDQPTPPRAGDEGAQPPRQSPLQGSVATATARIQVIIEAAEKAAAGIIDDAEAQARNYLEESRQRADRIAEQRAQEMSNLADTLVERAEAVKRHSDELLRALDQAKLQVEEKFRDEAAAISSSPHPEFQSEPSPTPAPPVQEAPPQVEEPAEQAPVHHLKPVEPPTPWVSEPPPGSAASSEVGVPPLEPAQPPSPPAAEEAPSVPPPPVGSRLAGSPPSDGARLLATQMAVAGSSRTEIESRLQNEFGIHDAGPMLDAILGRES